MEDFAPKSNGSTRNTKTKPSSSVTKKKWRWGTLFGSLDNFLNVITSLVIKSSILILAFTLAFVLYKELKDNSYVISSFGMPRQFQYDGYDGYDGVIMANMMLDKVRQIQQEGQTAKATNQFTHTTSRSMMDLQIMGMGFSVNAIVYHIRKALDVRHNQIKGEILRQGKQIKLTLRMTGFRPVSFEQPLVDSTNYYAALDSLIQKAGEEIVRITEPYQLAVYYENRGEFEQAITIIK